MDLYLTETADADNPDVGDLRFTLGQITLSGTGRDAAVQGIRQRLNTFRGEWFLDLRVGMPYYTDILTKNPDWGRVRSLFRAAILDDPQVADVVQLDLSLDGATRELTVTFRATLADGTILVSADYAPFILEVSP
jgi:hypothetical protein